MKRLEEDLLEENLTQKELDFDSDSYSNESDYTSQNFSPIVDTQEALNDKIISSSNKDKKITITIPVFKDVKAWLPLLNENGEIVYKNNEPVLIKRKTFKVFDKTTSKLINFPIKDWFNDSTTSSFLSYEEGRLIRETDDLSFSLYAEMCNNPNIDHTELITWLHWIKASFTDVSKGLEGRAVEKSKTTITKGETIAHEYRQDILNDAKEKVKKSGALGLGWFGGLI